MRKPSTDWNIYRTRFLIRAKQLTEPLVFVDGLGREHCGQPGDYLVESSDGARSIAPQKIFEDIYVAMGPVNSNTANPFREMPSSSVKRRAGMQRSQATA